MRSISIHSTDISNLTSDKVQSIDHTSAHMFLVKRMLVCLFGGVLHAKVDKDNTWYNVFMIVFKTMPSQLWIVSINNIGSLFCALKRACSSDNLALVLDGGVSRDVSLEVFGLGSLVVV